ncbi:MAG: hypothetical protein ACYC7L_04230 [Nitrospirota bacterium]
MKNSKLLLTLSLVFIGFAAQAADRTGNLLMHWDSYTISVKEPQGWKGDSANASALHSNLAFYRSDETMQNAKTMIRVVVAKKTDENTAEDLKYDMEGYRKNYPNIQFKDIRVKHPEYRTYAKLLYVENDFHEYVTYLNPGRRYPYLISVSMTIPKAAASKEALNAYLFVVGSMKALK